MHAVEDYVTKTYGKQMNAISAMLVYDRQMRDIIIRAFSF